MNFSTKPQNKKLHIVSLGCTKNLVDTEVMLGKLKDYKLSDEASDADVIIVNTCGFIDSAKEESIQTMLNLNEQRKDGSKLVMAGCLSERYKKDLSTQLPEVDIFTGVGDYNKIDKLIDDNSDSFSKETYLIHDEERVVTGSSYHAYIKISEGCNQTCSFCAIPSFKGKLKSRTIESIVNEVQKLVKKGFYDFSFVSQDSSSYLRDLNVPKNGLINLIKVVQEIQGVKSARILYLYPSTTTFELIEAIGNSKIFHNYFDMPIQHINNDMLKRMKRGFNKEKTLAQLDAMRALPNSFLRTTFIVGHPEESSQEFTELLNFVKQYPFDRANVFSYSNEEDTSAYGLSNQIADNIINNRATLLGDAISHKTTQNIKNLVGKTIDIVIDGVSEEHEYLLSAKALLWAPDIDGEIYVNDTSDSNIEYGRIYQAKITDTAGDKPLCTLIIND
jgi:ribosomal protein S12 methylthiotransferase RimO